MKKLLSIIMALVIMLSYTMSASAAVSTVPQSQSTIINQNGYKIEIFEGSKVNGQLQKIKFTNLKTGEIEYLETILENGKYSYLSTSKLGKFRTESASDKVGAIKITNLDTKEVKYLTPNKNSDTIAAQNATTQGSITPQSTSWYRWSCIESSYSKDWTTISACAGICCTICGLGIINSSILTAATAIVSNNLPDIWYIQEQFDDLNDSSHHMRNTGLYKYPDYTNLLDYESVVYYGGIF